MFRNVPGCSMFRILSTALFQTVGYVIVTKYSEMKEDLVFCFISRLVKFRHAKLTAGGEGRVRMLAIECVSFFLFFPFLPF